MFIKHYYMGPIRTLWAPGLMFQHRFFACNGNEIIQIFYFKCCLVSDDEYVMNLNMALDININVRDEKQHCKVKVFSVTLF